MNINDMKRTKGLSMRPSMRNDMPLSAHPTLDYSKIRVGLQTLTDAVIDSPTKKISPLYGDKEKVLRAISMNDIPTLRAISEYWYKTSGIYSRLCRYLAYLYCYDWYVTPFIEGGDTYPPEDSMDDISEKKLDKILTEFFKCLNYLDNFNVKKFCKRAALSVVKYGCYYGYIVQTAEKVNIQDLPIEYCRTRYKIQGRPVVEFNMKYFDDTYRDEDYRQRVIKLFPKEFAKGYKLYKANRLQGDFQGDTNGWYLLDTNFAFKFNLSDDDTPIFAAVIPYIIDLEDAQEMDRKKMAQNLLKIIIQRLPLDKNGDLIFDIDEAQELHNNAVAMIGKAVGIDVLTTFAEVDVADMADRSTTVTSKDDLTKVERALYNEAGVPQMLFNTAGNLALEKSILNDAAVMSDLIVQFEDLLNLIIARYNKNPKKLYYKAQILSTTIYNYQELSKIYEGQVKLGYSKMLSQVALGQSQSTILATAFFENDLLNLVSVFVPPLSSNTMNAEALAQQQSGRGTRGSTALIESGGGEQEGAGRPELPDDKKSEKTIKNLESQ